MPTGKRASMREGPLAALFRKTAEDTGAKGHEEEKEPKRSRKAPEQQRRRALPEPESHATEVEDEAPHIPSPQERLRHAFSSDIPQNLLDPPAQSTAQEPRQDVYARPERA